MEDGMGKRKVEKPNIEGDRMNIIMLLLMYLFQGILSGFYTGLPLVLQNRNATYADQAEFSIAHYPFSFKILWAPIVDCVFFKRFGRRKTWVIPTQYLMGLVLLFVSLFLDDWIGSKDGRRRPSVHLMALMFFLGTFFSAVQDVAVDGWSLTMLQRRNVGYAALCQSVGGTVGQFISHQICLILDSKDIANLFRSVPQKHGFVRLEDFMFAWSVVLFVTTTFILIFQKDNSLEVLNAANEDEDCECRLGLKESYEHLWDIVKLRPILVFSAILFTYFLGFGPAWGVSPFKIMEAGISRDSLVLLSIPALPFQIILSVMLRRQTTGPRSMRSFLNFHMMFLITSTLLAVALFFSSIVKNQSGAWPIWYYCVLFFIYNARTVIRHLMMLAVCSYFCRISDPRFGGIYLTLLITVSNIGNNWPVTLSLSLVDLLTINSCSGSGQTMSCRKVLDGFYVETAIFVAMGLLWRWWAKAKIFELEKLPPSAWIIEREKLESIEREAFMVLGENDIAKKING